MGKLHPHSCGCLAETWATKTSSPNLWFRDWGSISKSYVYTGTLHAPFRSLVQGSEICFEITEHLLISWFSTQQWPEVKPLHAHNVLLKDDFIYLHVHLPLREYHSEYTEGKEEERLPELNFNAPVDVYMTPTLPIQQRVQVSGDRMIHNLKTFVELLFLLLPSPWSWVKIVQFELENKDAHWCPSQWGADDRVELDFLFACAKLEKLLRTPMEN